VPEGTFRKAGSASTAFYCLDNAMMQAIFNSLSGKMAAA